MVNREFFYVVNQDEPDIQLDQSPTVLTVDTTRMQEAVTSSVVTSGKEHIHHAVQAELEKVFPTIQQPGQGQ